MKLLRACIAEMIGLFVEDGFLAVATLVWVGAITIILKGLTAPPLLAGTALLAGCISILLVSVWRARGAR
jgi:hypothetical protein